MWDEKVVVVAGGSKGLGLQIAKTFHSHGATTVLLARNEPTVVASANELNDIRKNSSFAFSVDLTNDESRQKTIAQIISKLKKIDVWVNAVGQSIRTSFANTTIEHYRRLMEQNFFASIGSSLDVLPSLEKTNGHLINIGSLAAKTAWPLLSPYVTSKHALAGFAKQLRIEGPGNVHYMFVCPGPIKSDRIENRYQSQTSGLPENAEKPGAGAPVKTICPKWLAQKIVEGCVKRTPELVIPFKSRLLFSISQMWPKLGDRLIRRFCK